MGSNCGVNVQDFEMIIVVFIFINCASMAAYRPMDGNSPLNRALGIIEVCATAVFTVEVLLELAAAGSYRKYFSSSWNLFDFVLVAAGFTKFLPFGNSTSAFKVHTLSFFCGYLAVLLHPLLLLVLCRLGYLNHAFGTLGYGIHISCMFRWCQQ